MNERKLKRGVKLSLRSMMIAFSVLSVWIGWYVVRSQAQRNCVNEIQSLGGGVIYSFRYPNGKYSSTASPPGPSFLREQLGLDYFDYVVAVDFNHKEIEKLPDLAALTRIESLWLADTKVSDLSNVSELRTLKNLWIAETSVTDLDAISRLDNLEWLSIANTRIDDLTPLNKMTNLGTLDATGTNLSPGHLAEFARKLPNCEVLENAE